MQVQSLDSDRSPTSGAETNGVTKQPGWCFVTVEQATAWLSKRQHNRKMRQNDVNFLSRQMIEGLWRKNPQPLLFEERTGRLVDGQHRLSAVVQSGIPMWFRVDVIEDGVMPVLDTGRSRNAADVLALYDTESQGQYYAKSAALRMLLAWERNRNPFVGVAGGSGRLSNLEVLVGIERYPTLLPNVQRGVQLQHAGIPGGAGTWAALLTRFDSIDPDFCEEFFEGMLTGAGLPQGSPVLAVRNRLKASRATRYALPRPEIATLVIRGWNAFVTGRNLTVVRGRVRMTDGVKRTAEAIFPEPAIPKR